VSRLGAAFSGDKARILSLVAGRFQRWRSSG
jgi:hypothetical protein